jgi:hypothetical protein
VSFVVGSTFSQSSRFHGKKSEIARSIIEMGTPLRWSIACLLFVLAAGVMAFNKMTVCSWMRRKNPAATISLIGGCIGAAGCLVSPVAWLNKAWWLPTMFDVMGAPYLLIIAWMGIQECFKSRAQRGSPLI